MSDTLVAFSSFSAQWLPSLTTHFFEISLNFTYFWNNTRVVTMNNILELLLKYSFHTFMTSSILLQLKSWNARGASHHSPFRGSHPTISHTFYTLATQWMSSPSKKWEHWSNITSYFICLVWNRGNRKGKFKMKFEMKWNRQGWSQNSVKHQRKQPTALITCWLSNKKAAKQTS